MKTVFLSVLLLSSISAKGQQLDLMSVSSDSLDERMNLASVELYQAGHDQRNAVLWGAVGTLFTLLSADKAKVAKYDHNLVVGLGCFTAGGYIALVLKSSAHSRKAARLLHHQ